MSLRISRAPAAARAKPTAKPAFDPVAAGKKLERLYEGGKLASERKTPDVKGLKGFAVKDLDARAMDDSITSAIAYVDQRRGKVFLKVNGVERLPWEGIESRFTQWYSAPLSALGR